jgi:hypothetical protein
MAFRVLRHRRLFHPHFHSYQGSVRFPMFNYPFLQERSNLADDHETRIRVPPNLRSGKGFHK